MEGVEIMIKERYESGSGRGLYNSDIGSGRGLYEGPSDKELH